MDPKTYHLVKRLFHEARELPIEERASFLESATAGDAGVRAEIESLLAESQRIGDFLEEPALEGAAKQAPRERVERPIPERIGAFRIQRVLGDGGMGVVYLAEQDSPRRFVALKVLRPESASLIAFERFRLEAEVLAKFSHRGIAQIYQAGTAESATGSLSYIAMEYVSGVPLLQFAEENQLPLENRLRLMSRICLAVEEAHAHGVVHRDLKPSNLLVDHAGVPRVLDFGIARMIGGAGEPRNQATSQGQILGTLAYMSPEQASGEVDAIDATSDVYALGVVLYELLTGRMPYDTHGLLVHEAVRVIREAEPVPLSSIKVELAGDVETIVLKALEKEPRRRYAGAGELASDLRNVLEHRPIAARPPSALDRFSKLVRRHAPLALGIGVAFLALSGGLVASLFALHRNTITEHRAGLVREAVFRLQDVHALKDLESEAQGLWPAVPDRVPDMLAWLDRARVLERHLPRHREFQRRIQEGLATPAGRERIPLSPRDEQWLLEVQTELVHDLERFVDPELGTRADLERRLAFAMSLFARTIDERRADWTAAIAAISDRRRSPLYGGLTIEPQLGLVPIGPDPATGLFEFAHFGSTGAVPQRDASSGCLGLDAASALVLVLVPAGESGATAEGERGSTIEPFFLAKHELTQAQWTRFAGNNPSDGSAVTTNAEASSLFPVDSVSHADVVSLLSRLGLRPPTLAEWRFAARVDEGQLERVELHVERVPSVSIPSERVPVVRSSISAWGFLGLDAAVLEWCADAHGPDGRSRALVGLGCAKDKTALLIEAWARDSWRGTSAGVRPARSLDRGQVPPR